MALFLSEERLRAILDEVYEAGFDAGGLIMFRGTGMAEQPAKKKLLFDGAIQKATCDKEST